MKRYDAQGRLMTNVADLTPTSGSSGWTAQAVPFADSGGRLAEDADLNWNDSTQILNAGPSVIGALGTSAVFAREDMLSGTDYCLGQTSAGASLLNAKSGQNITLRVNNTAVATVAAGTITVADATDIAVNTGTGTKIGTATGQKLAFHNATPVVQRSGAAQAAVATTGATNVAPFGYTTAAQADAIVTLVNELRAALVAKGLIKGSA